MDTTKNTNTPALSNEMVYLVQRFKEVMELNGYTLAAETDAKVIPTITASKPNHYEITAYCVLAGNPAFAVSDSDDIFNFVIKAPFTNITERFDKMVSALEPFIKKELNKSRLELKF